mgnify:FL=1|tara:strand:+ start:344 stop:526 length:183 start_codon:yes stop_codon:yes gene_type:complete
MKQLNNNNTIKINIDNENELTDNEYDIINNIFIRKAKKMKIIDKYKNQDISWVIECKINN